jgi:glycosyltransferase involved in cell wall biosynthesis
MQKNGSTIIYLGRRGGGAHLLRECIRFCNGFGFPYFTITSTYLDHFSKSTLETKRNLNVRTFRNPVQAIFETLLLPLKCLKIVRFLAKVSTKKLVFLMPHIWDLPIIAILKALGYEINVVIHDVTPHKGELFPLRILTYLECKLADYIFILSAFSASKLSAFKPKIKIAFLPTPIPASANCKIELLFIGRIQEYKGLPVLLEAMALPEAKLMHLTVVGEFHKWVPSSTQNVTIFNQWISESAFEQFIASADIVILPYVEATQSGIIPIAIANRVPVVVTPVGGLPEMVEAFNCGIVASGNDPRNLLSAILECKATNGFDFKNKSNIQDLPSTIFKG